MAGTRNGLQMSVDDAVWMSIFSLLAGMPSYHYAIADSEVYSMIRENYTIEKPQIGRRRKKPRRIRLMSVTLPVLALMLFSYVFIGRNTTEPIPPDAVRGDPYINVDKPAEEDNPVSSASTDDWRLILVNPWNPLPTDYEISFTELVNGHRVDERCYPDLQQMMDDCRAEGLQPIICSSYRSQETQQSLFDNKVQRLIAQGYSAKDAPAGAAKVVALPGTSEHQLGLALDIVDVNNQNLDDSQAQTAAQLWLMENSWRYGFILRYPADKTDITGITYEPWHYRYVGKDAAKEIYEQGICLEEYLDKLP